MLIRTTDRKEAYKALINTGLKDTQAYCNNCGKKHPEKLRIIPCCEDPQVGDNADHTRAVVKQNEFIRETRKNEFASDGGRNFRWGLSLPAWMYQALDTYESQHGDGRRFLKTRDDMIWFAKNFPQFAIPARDKV
jgi:hypothetical protein